MPRKKTIDTENITPIDEISYEPAPVTDSLVEPEEVSYEPYQPAESLVEPVEVSYEPVVPSEADYKPAVEPVLESEPAPYEPVVPIREEPIAEPVVQPEAYQPEPEPYQPEAYQPAPEPYQPEAYQPEPYQPEPLYNPSQPYPFANQPQQPYSPQPQQYDVNRPFDPMMYSAVPQPGQPVYNHPYGAAQPPQPVGTNKKYNLLCLIISVVLLAVQAVLVITMNLGIAVVNGILFTADGITNFTQYIQVAIDIDQELMNAIPVILMLVIFVFSDIFIVIRTIIAVIKFFGMFKLNRAYDSEMAYFGKFARNTCKSLGSAVLVIAMSFMASGTLTKVGMVIVIMASIVYAGLAAFKQIFKAPGLQEEKFNVVGFIVNLAKKLLVYMMAFIVVANIKPCLSILFENSIRLDSIRGFGDDIMLTVSTIWFLLGRESLSIIPYWIAAGIAGKVISSYALNNSKRDANKSLMSKFIVLLIFSIIIFVADCYFTGVYNGGATMSDYMYILTHYWLAMILCSIAGIIITAVTGNKKLPKAKSYENR